MKDFEVTYRDKQIKLSCAKDDDKIMFELLSSHPSISNISSDVTPEYAFKAIVDIPPAVYNQILDHSHYYAEDSSIYVSGSYGLKLLVAESGLLKADLKSHFKYVTVGDFKYSFIDDSWVRLI